MINKSPFKFLDSYLKADFNIFFGREKETEQLYDALSGVKHLLVYGPSGAGKTSLIECGLRNQFSDADWLAITIRRGNNITASVFARIREQLRNPFEVDEQSLMPSDPHFEFSHAVERLFSEQFKPVYLLFDQFEELLIQGDESEQQAFFQHLQQLIYFKIPCRILLIIREEFIGHLSAFESFCPSIFQNRFRVEKMSRRSVQEVIWQILEAEPYQAHFKAHLPEKLAQAILLKLPDSQKEIELAHVQVFLDELWDRAVIEITDGIPILHTGLIRESDNLERILDLFLKKQLRELTPAHGDKKPLELLALLISERYTKLQLSVEEIEITLNKNGIATADLSHLLSDLLERRILRTLKIGEQTKFEISHDVLARVVGGNLTEEIKLRERAQEVYRVYEAREGYLSREDISYIRPFAQYFPIPEPLSLRIEASEENLTKQIQETLNKARRYYANDLANKSQIALHKGDRTVAFRIAELAYRYVDNKNVNVLNALLDAVYHNDNPSKLPIPWASNLEGHRHWVNHLAVSPNGQYVATACSDKTARIYDLNTLKNVFTLINFEKDAMAAAFSPDGKYFVTGAGNKAVIWNLVSNEWYRTLQGGNDDISMGGLTFSPDGQLLAAACRDNTAKIWEIETGELVVNLDGHSKPVNKAVFTPDGKQLITCSGDSTAKIWNLKTKKVHFTIEGHSKGIIGLAVSKDGRKLATGSSDNSVKIWNIETGTLMWSLEGHKGSVLSVAFSPDGKQLATASYDKTAKIWEIDESLKNPARIVAEIIGHTDSVRCVAFSTDGRKLITGSIDKTAKVWDLQSGAEALILDGHTEGVYETEFSQDGEMLTTASYDDQIITWSLKTGQTLNIKGGINYYFDKSKSISPNGRYLAEGFHDHDVFIIDLETKNIALQLKGHHDKVFGVAFSPDGRYLASGSKDGVSKIWDLSSGKAIQTLEGHSNTITCVAFSPDGKLIVTGSYDHTARVWDTSTGKTILVLEGHSMSVDSAAFSPDGRLLVTGSGDGTAKLWELETGRAFCTIPGHDDDIISTVFSADMTQLATGSEDGIVKVWGLTPQSWFKLKGHGKQLAGIGLSSLSEYGLEDLLDIRPENEHLFLQTETIWQIAAFAELYKQKVAQTGTPQKDHYDRARRLYQFCIQSGEGDKYFKDKLAELDHLGMEHGW